MSNRVLVNNVDHKDLRIITDRAARYGDAVMFTLTFPFEFRNIQSFYPILFHRRDNGDYYPVALFGFQEGENLFLDERGWNATYVPAMIRRDPFLIGYKKVAAENGMTDLRMLSLDLDNPRVNHEKGEPLFQPLGGRTPFLESAALLVEKIYEGIGHSERFVQALVSQDLIESVTMEIRLNDGSINQLLGFHTINEQRLQQLPGSVLEDFSRNGYLMPLFMVIASMANVQRLVEFKNAAVAAGR